MSRCRHGAPVHPVLPADLPALWEAVHLGRQVLRDGEEGAGRRAGHPGRAGAPHERRGAAVREQEHPGADLPLRPAPARWARLLHQRRPSSMAQKSLSG